LRYFSGNRGDTDLRLCLAVALSALFHASNLGPMDKDNRGLHTTILSNAGRMHGVNISIAASVGGRGAWGKRKGGGRVGKASFQTALKKREQKTENASVINKYAACKYHPSRKHASERLNLRREKHIARKKKI
jgi:hypothetical protein